MCPCSSPKFTLGTFSKLKLLIHLRDVSMLKLLVHLGNVFKAQAPSPRWERFHAQAPSPLWGVSMLKLLVQLGDVFHYQDRSPPWGVSMFKLHLRGVSMLALGVFPYSSPKSTLEKFSVLELLVHLWRFSML